MLKSPKTFADELIERTSSMLDEIESTTVHKAEEAPSPHEVRLAPLDTNPLFQNLGEFKIVKK